jgi:iron complex outermembrane recepter protein
MAGAAVATALSAGVARADEPSVEKVTVTGTRIPQKGLKSVSPVSTITGNEAKISGTTSVETLLNDLPQVNPTQGAEVSNGSSGSATVDLRGLGANRTLVLINGKRLHPANIVAPVADLNNIPVAMIDRVEVLTGGASAVYGADAVAGVVNFIFRKNFEGVEVGTSYQINDHDNDDAVTRDIVTGAGFRVPERHVNDGRVFTAFGVMGSNSADGKGNMTAYIQYRNAEALLQSERDYSACAIASDDAGGFFCLGSSNGPTGRFTAITPAAAGTRFTANAGTPGTMREFLASADTFNFNPTNFLQRPDDRYLLGFSGHYQIDDNVDFYTDVSFMDDRTVAQIAASGFFANSGPVGGNFLVNCDNPLLDTGAAEGTTTIGTNVLNVFTPLNALCGSQAPVDLGTTGTATVNIGRRFVETNLGRQDDFQSTSYRLVGGIRGQIEDWDYDVYAQYGTTSTPRAYLNDVSRTRAQRAILVAIDNRVGSPTLGQPVCTSVLDGTDASCIPANIFSFGELSREAIAYMSGTGIQKTTTEEQIVSASLNGDIGATSPWAADPIQMALGAEYRFNALKHISDDVFSSGDLLGQGGSTPNVDGHFDVWEAFGEIQIPILQDQPFAKLVEVTGGYRISDYDLSGLTHTYKYAGSWMPVDDVRLRGSFQHAVRAPNVIELFTPSFQGLWGGTDPCALTSSSSPGTNFYTAAQCANTGLSLAQFNAFTDPNGGGAFQCPAAQCSGQFGGNASLKPESSDTKSFGLVFTPTFLKGFNATIDYYDIEIEDQITVISQTAIVGDCAVNNNPLTCALINRDPVTGVLSNSTTLGVGVDSLVVNSGTVNTRGVDVEANYRFDLGDAEAGTMTLGFSGTFVDKAETNYGLGFESFDCVGFFGLVCGNPVPEWKHKARVTWSAPFDVNFTVAWRHISGVELDANSGASSVFDFPAGGPLGDLSDGSIPAYDYFDLGVDWNITDNVRLLGGINNVVDEDPPLIDSQFHGISSPPFGNANTYPVVYDSMGRQVFVSMTTRF